MPSTPLRVVKTSTMSVDCTPHCQPKLPPVRAMNIGLVKWPFLSRTTSTPLPRRPPAMKATLVMSGMTAMRVGALEQTVRNVLVAGGAQLLEHLGRHSSWPSSRACAQAAWCRARARVPASRVNSRCGCACLRSPACRLSPTAQFDYMRLQLSCARGVNATAPAQLRSQNQRDEELEDVGVEAVERLVARR